MQTASQATGQDGLWLLLAELWQSPLQALALAWHCSSTKLLVDLLALPPSSFLLGLLGELH